MPVPAYDQFIEPLLACLVDSDGVVRATVVQMALARSFGLSDADMAVLLPSGKQATYKNRIGWAHDRLKRSGYSVSVRRGFWKATEEGRRKGMNGASGENLYTPHPGPPACNFTQIVVIKR